MDQFVLDALNGLLQGLARDSRHGHASGRRRQNTEVVALPQIARYQAVALREDRGSLNFMPVFANIALPGYGEQMVEYVGRG